MMRRSLRIATREDVGHLAFGALVAATLTFLAAPLLVTVVVSFSDGTLVSFPPEPWGLGAWKELVESGRWLPAFRQSVAIALPAAALATVVGVATAVAMYRSRLPLLLPLLQAMGTLPLVIPVVAYATAVFILYAKLKVVGSYWAIVAIDAMHALPIVLVLCAGAVTRIPREYELAAMSLGAGRARATVGITLRLMSASIGAAFVLAFLLAFGEATFIVFVGGTEWNTLPREIYGSLQSGVTPVLAAVSTALMVLSAALVAVVTRLGGVIAPGPAPAHELDGEGGR